MLQARQEERKVFNQLRIQNASAQELGRHQMQHNGKVLEVFLWVWWCEWAGGRRSEVLRYFVQGTFNIFGYLALSPEAGGGVTFLSSLVMLSVMAGTISVITCTAIWATAKKETQKFGNWMKSKGSVNFSFTIYCRSLCASRFFHYCYYLISGFVQSRRKVVPTKKKHTFIQCLV